MTTTANHRHQINRTRLIVRAVDSAEHAATHYADNFPERLTSVRDRMNWLADQLACHSPAWGVITLSHALLFNGKGLTVSDRTRPLVIEAIRQRAIAVDAPKADPFVGLIS